MKNKFIEETYIPKAQRKTILFSADDLRMPSGVGTMSREIVLNTAQHYNWVQIGAAIQHPEAGKIVDISQSVNEYLGITDASVIIYPNNGYGDADMVRHLIKQHNVKAMLHYTDPRFWIWLYQMEHELRQQIPLLFYTVWDDLPYPMYNAPYYESCDWIGCISKQSMNIVKNVWRNNAPKDNQVKYVPHGINAEQFFPITPDNVTANERLQNMKNALFTGSGPVKKEMPEFVIMYNSRNIRRKCVTNIILAYKKFISELPKEKADKIALLLHTQPIDDNGTDLPTLVNALVPEGHIFFSPNKIDNTDLNCLYNIADVTINMSNAEGFGLGTAESIMAGTPIIATVTGGLQDQMRFEDENGKWIEFSPEFGSNHAGKYKKHGEWAFPLWPAVRSLTGSPPTPYIMEDFVNWEDATTVLHEAYNLGRTELKRRGLVGREWMNGESGMNATEMANRFINGIDDTLETWTPRKRFELFKSGQSLDTSTLPKHTGIIYTKEN